MSEWKIMQGTFCTVYCDRYTITSDSIEPSKIERTLIVRSRARSSRVFPRYICRSNARSGEKDIIRPTQAKTKRRLYLLVEDTVLFIDICDVARIVVWTLSREFAPLVDTIKVGDQ